MIAQVGFFAQTLGTANNTEMQPQSAAPYPPHLVTRGRKEGYRNKAVGGRKERQPHNRNAVK